MKDQVVLNYMGRIIYNYYATEKPQKKSKSPDGEEYFSINGEIIRFVINEHLNIFRQIESSLFGEVNRSFDYPCTNIREAITLKKLVDKSIIGEIGIIGIENVCNSTYTNSFKFSKFTSNIESHFFSKKGLHIAHVGSLSSYSQIDFSCFDTFDNNQIKSILINTKEVNIDSPESLKLSQMISLFLCETSRNPASFFTIPMCLELGEWAFNQYQNKKIEELKEFIHKVHKKSIFFMEKLENAQKAKKVNEDIINDKDSKDGDVKKAERSIVKAETDMKELFIIDVESQPITKGKLVKDIVMNLFPLSMENAVQASRYISNRINEMLKKEQTQGELYHHYDLGMGSIKDAKKLLAIESTLIDIYKEYLMGDKIGIEQKFDFGIPFNISQEWFGITYSEDEFKDQDISCIELIGKALDF